MARKIDISMLECALLTLFCVFLGCLPFLGNYSDALIEATGLYFAGIALNGVCWMIAFFFLGIMVQIRDRRLGIQRKAHRFTSRDAYLAGFLAFGLIPVGINELFGKPAGNLERRWLMQLCMLIFWSLALVCLWRFTVMKNRTEHTDGQ